MNLHEEARKRLNLPDTKEGYDTAKNIVFSLLYGNQEDPFIESIYNDHGGES